MAAAKWVATVTGQRWLVAKIRVRRMKAKILKVYSFDLEESMEIQSGAEVKEKVSRAGKELKALLKANGRPSRNLTLAFSCPGVITRIVTVPIMKKKLLDTLFTEQLDQYFTLNVADYIIDYRILTEVEEEGQKRYQILLVAFPRDVWELQLQVLQAAKVKPKAIDIQFECLTRLYTRLESVDSAIINLSGDRAEIVILEKGIFFLYSDVNFDSNSSMLKEEPSHANNMEELENVFYPVMRNLEDFLEFFRTRHFGKTVDVIYITGEYSSVVGIDKVFERNFDIKSQVGYPMGWKPKFSKKANRFHENKLGGVIGLALRED